MKRIIIFLFIGFIWLIAATNDTSDMCYEEMETTGVMCMNIGPCGGGLGCKRIYPIKNIGNSYLKNVKIYYDETELGGGIFGNCGVNPSGSCSETYNVGFGSTIGILGKATEFDVSRDVNPGEEVDIWTSNMVSGGCFYGDNLYIKYYKNGELHQGKLFPCYKINEGGRDFNLRKKFNVTGNYTIIGNTVLCKKNSTGECIKTDDPNSNHYLSYVNKGNYNTTYPNSSKASLHIPDKASVLWAGVYIQGDFSYDDWYFSQDDIIKILKNNSVILKHKGNTYTLLPRVVDYYSNEYYDYWGYPIITYSIFIPFSRLIGKSASDVNGEWTVGNLMVSEGNGGSLGFYGAWTLVVVYGDENETYKNISVFDGYKEISYSNHKKIEIPISGFLTPLHGDVNSKVSAFVGEGDLGIRGDKIFMTDKENPSSRDWTNLNKNNTHQKNAFYSGIDHVPNREPALTNNFGIDIHTYNVGTNGLKIIKNGDTNAKFKFVTNEMNNGDADTYYPSLFIFSTDLYIPKVCYSGLEFYKNGQKLDNGANIQIGEDITVKFNIRNDGNETAKYVYIKNLFENNLSEYKRNSTRVRNVLQTSLRPFDDNEVIGDLGVYYDEDNQLWAVGILGDSNKEFKPTSTDNYIATVEFSFRTKNEGNLSLNFYTDYNYTIGNVPKQYTGVLHECNNTKYYLNISPKVTGIFNVVEESFSGNTDPMDANDTLNQIYTKIVNKNYNMKVIKIKDDNETLENFKGIVEVDLIDNPDNENECKNNTALKKFFVAFDDNDTSNFSFVYNKALRNGRFRIKYVTKNGSLFNWDCAELNNTCVWNILQQISDNPPCQNVCDSNNSNYNDCLICAFGSNLTGKPVCSRDNFAIRPAKYKVSNTNQKLIAGKDINITVQAIDYNGALISDFNFANAPVELNITDALGCKTGTLNKPSSLQTTLNFINGEANLTLNYSEVGDLNISVKEYKNGNEYAHVDANDSVDSSGNVETNEILLIGEGNSILSRFYPDHFAISGSYNNHAGGTFTYISSDLNMSAELNLTITAKNNSSNKTENYNKECYAQNFDLNISYDDLNASKVPTILYEINSTVYNTATNNDLNFSNLSKNFFDADNNGTATILIKINFDKNYTNPIEEFNMTVRDVNVSDVNGTFGTRDINDSARFIYGRIKVSNAASYSSDINTTFEYQYWTNDGWIKNTDHTNVNFGDFNHTLNAAINPYVTITNSPSVNNGDQKVVFHTVHALPYSAKVHLQIDSWLWYHPLAKNYQDPSSANTNCLTHPCLKLDFLKSGSAWGGVQAVNNAKFSEENRTSEINASHTDVNVSKSQVKKINW